MSVTSSNSVALTTEDKNAVATSDNHGRNATLTINGTAVQSDGLKVNVVTANLQADFTLNALAGEYRRCQQDLRRHRRRSYFQPCAQVNTANLASIGIGNINTGSIGKYVPNGTVYSLSDLGTESQRRRQQRRHQPLGAEHRQRGDSGTCRICAAA